MPSGGDVIFELKAMGRPTHYSAEIPLRCQALIEQLGRQVADASDPHGQWGGPLKTTFLVAMATPMVVLPIERVFKPAAGKRRGVADDAALDPHFSQLVMRHLGPGQVFEQAPFFVPGDWSYLAQTPVFEVAAAWPYDRLDALQTEEARGDAAAAQCSDILLTLRNALAHGGVTYLDRHGRHYEAATNMLGFASYVNGDTKRLRLLRISVTGFETFLSLWAGWLSDSGVLAEFDRRGPGYFEYAAE